MIFKLENVGKIENANIKLDGITVIAGENNTGKSTIGKMLFCLFNSFYNIERQIKDERCKTISRVIHNFYREMTERATRTKRFEAKKFVNDIIENRETFILDIKLLEKELKRFYLQVDNNFDEYINSELLIKLSKKILDFLQIEDDEIIKVILKERLNVEFAMKIGHLNCSNKKSKVCLEIKNNRIDVDIVNNEEVVINDYIDLIKNITYIDDPFVLDELNKKMPVLVKNFWDHGIDLFNKLTDKNEDSEFGALDEVIVKQKIGKVLDIMSDVCDGEMFENEGGTYVYKTEKLNDNLEVVNLSAGIKSFVILRKLLQNGSINENGLLILDEPEIHLHPEWQLKFAEVIVLIQKEFGTNILLNTHSPYFLNAIEVYSKKYDIHNICNYYLTEELNMKTKVLDVTETIELIYEKLAKPLQKLESLEYK